MNPKSGRSKIENRKSKIEVLVVDDSLTVRKKIIEILKTVPDISIAGEARNGQEAIELTEKLRPSVILMDIVMPVMSGLAAVEYIMVHKPTPIVVHSSAEHRGETYKTWDAMKAGALAKIEKTDAEKDTEKWENDLIQTVRAASRVHVIRRRKTAHMRQDLKKPVVRPQVGVGDYNIVAIGASTGGPGVIANILKDFPSDFKLPVLVVIHMPNSSENTFAEWLNENCSLNVDPAFDGELLNGKTGRVFIASSDKHLTVKRNRIRLLDSPQVNFCRPSVDVLFQSLAEDRSIKPIATLLTGMGQDGALGLKAVRDYGGYTICQDEATSVIYGMPKAAANMGAADAVLPDYKIAEKIITLANRI